MNKLLFISSLIFGIFLLLILFKNKDKIYKNNSKYYKLIFITILLGIITYYLNHYYSNNILKYGDRCMMLISIIIIFNVICNIKKCDMKYWLLFVIILSMALYFIKYIYENEYTHLLSHMSITYGLYILIELI